MRLDRAIFKQFLLNEKSDVEVLTLSGSKFHSLEARKTKVSLPELVLAFGSFPFPPCSTRIDFRLFATAAYKVDCGLYNNNPEVIGIAQSWLKSLYVTQRLFTI